MVATASAIASGCMATSRRAMAGTSATAIMIVATSHPGSATVGSAMTAIRVIATRTVTGAMSVIEGVTMTMTAIATAIAIPSVAKGRAAGGFPTEK